MKKIIIALSIILAFAMFNSSAKASGDGCQLAIIEGEPIYSECDCFDYQCSGYRMYDAYELCGTTSCDDDGCHDCMSRYDPYNWYGHVNGMEYECYTPRFGCQGEGEGQGEECNVFDPWICYYYDHWEHCVCLLK